MPPDTPSATVRNHPGRVPGTDPSGAILDTKVPCPCSRPPVHRTGSSVHRRPPKPATGDRRRFPYSGPVDPGALLRGPRRDENEPPTQGDNQLVSTNVPRLASRASNAASCSSPANARRQRIVLLTHDVNVPRSFRDILWRHLVGQSEILMRRRSSYPPTSSVATAARAACRRALSTVACRRGFIGRHGGRKTGPGPPFRDRLLSRQFQIGMTPRAVRHQLFVSERLRVRCNSASARRWAAWR